MKNKSLTISRKGFTLVEIMIVVVIIGILAAMAAPTLDRVRQRAIATRIANDFRIFGAAFQQYAMENGDFPADTGPGAVPAGMSEYLKASIFTSKTPAGGYYDWDSGVFGVVAGVSVFNPEVDAATLLMVDEIMDDGNLGTGIVRSRSGGLMYVIQE